MAKEICLAHGRVRKKGGLGLVGHDASQYRIAVIPYEAWKLVSLIKYDREQLLTIEGTYNTALVVNVLGAKRATTEEK